MCLDTKLVSVTFTSRHSVKHLDMQVFSQAPHSILSSTWNAFSTLFTYCTVAAHPMPKFKVACTAAEKLMHAIFCSRNQQLWDYWCQLAKRKLLASFNDCSKLHKMFIVLINLFGHTFLKNQWFSCISCSFLFTPILHWISSHECTSCSQYIYPTPPIRNTIM